MRARRLRLPLLAVLAVAVSVAVGPASQARSPRATRTCASVLVDGQKVPVRATSISCTRARRVAKTFATSGKLPRGWAGVNPAGCEHVLFHKRDRRYVLAHDYHAPSGHPLIRTARFRGCVS